MKSFVFSLLAFALSILPGLGQTRQISFAWPQPQDPASVPAASFPLPIIPWISSFEANIDQFANGPYDIMFDGDSITANWLNPYGPLTYWQQFYGSLKPVDIAIGGDQVQNLIWRAQNGGLAGQDPKLIVVMNGGANIGGVASDVATGIQILIGQYETRCPHAHILLLGQLPRGTTPTDPGRPWPGECNAYYSALYGNGQDPRVTYLDFGSQFLDANGDIPLSLMSDGLHPTAAGYLIWGNAIQPVVNQYVANASAYTYPLTVTSGSGSGSYTAGSVVTVTANAPAAGYQFAGWTGATGYLANPGAATTTLTMLANAMSLTATYSATQTSPSVPTGLTATDGIGQTLLTWTTGTGAASYNIYRGTTAGGESTTPIATGIAAASYQDTAAMTSSTTYYYTVAAVNSSGTSGYSNESTAGPQLFPNRQISFTWPQPQDPATVPWECFPEPSMYWVDLFETNVDKLSAGPYSLVFDGDSIAAGLQNQSLWQQYYGSIQALDIGIADDQVQNIAWRVQNGSLAGQNPKLIVVEAGTFNYNEAPSDVAAGIQLLLSQYETQCPNSHILLLGIFPRNASPTDPARAWVSQVNQILATYASQTVTYLDIGSQFLQPDGTLSTAVMPDGLDPSTQGYAIWLNAIQPTVNQYVMIPSAAPSAPTGLTAVAANSQVGLTWTTGAGATSFNIYRGTTAGGEAATPIATGVTTTAYTDTGLTNGTTYYYTVASVNSLGTSAHSTEASAQPAISGTVPALPTGLTASPGNDQVGLAWAASAGATSYNVYRGAASGGENSTPIATGVTQASYTDTGLANGSTYYYEIAAVNDSGTSACSSEVSCTPSSTGSVPAAPTLTATAGNAQVSLTWTAITGATGYNIYRGSGGQTATEIATGLTSTTYTDLNLANGVTYYYTVTAVNSYGPSNSSNQVVLTPLATSSSLITWGAAQNMSGNSDVSTTGVLFDAATFYGAAVTVNGVTFNRLVSNGTIEGYTDYSDGKISANSPGNAPGAYTSAFTTTSPSSVAYSDLTSVLGFCYFTNGTVALTGLTVGDSYQIQVWAWDAGAGSNAHTTLTGANSVTLFPETGQFAIGTFTAAANSVAFNYNYVSQYGVINAIAVRDTTITTGVTYTQWSNNYFASNPANAGGTATPQNDGVTNLLKYLCDINPAAPMSASDWAALPAAGLTTLSGSSYLTLTYRQNPLETGLTINVQTSSDLQTWQTVAPNYTLNAGTDAATGDPLTKIEVLVNPPGASKQFIRLNVTAP